MRIKDDKQTQLKKKQILDIAQTIILTEGIEQLSIRKIAMKLHQTPGIIYHYYDNKDAIMYEIIKQGYEDILHIIHSVSNIASPTERLAHTLKNYIHGMCDKGDLFLLLMSSKDLAIRQYITILDNDAIHRKSIQSLYQLLEDGVKQKQFQCDDYLVTTQWIWCSTFGIIHQIVCEQPETLMREKLIDVHIQSIMDSLRRTL